MVDQIPSDLRPYLHGVKQLPQELEAGVVFLVGVFGPQVGLGQVPYLLELFSDPDGCGQQRINLLEESQSSGFGCCHEHTVGMFLHLDSLPGI